MVSGDDADHDSKEIKQYTREEVAKHNTVASTWLIMNDKIYDVTKFLEEVGKMEKWITVI